MKGFFVKNTRLILLIFLFVVIFLSTIGIFLVNKNSFKSTSTLGNDLIGYASIKEKFNALKLINDYRYTESILQLNIVENKNLPEKDRYKALAQTFLLLANSYSRSSNPKIYNFIKNDLNTFAKDNFNKYYKKIDFTISCQDPSCADSTTPKEIVNIINEINSIKTISEENRKMMILNLQYDTYLPSDNIHFKAISYLNTALTIRTDKEYTDAGVNNKIGDEIEAFVKNKYPKDYIKLTP